MALFWLSAGVSLSLARVGRHGHPGHEVVQSQRIAAYECNVVVVDILTPATTVDSLKSTILARFKNFTIHVCETHSDIALQLPNYANTLFFLIRTKFIRTHTLRLLKKTKNISRLQKLLVLRFDLCSYKK